MDFKWQDRQDGGSYILAEDVNILAGGVIEGITKAEEAKKASDYAIDYTDETARLGFLHSETFLVGDLELNEKFHTKITEIKMVKGEERDNPCVEFYAKPNFQGLIATIEGEGVHKVSIKDARYINFHDGWSADSELTLTTDTRTKLYDEVKSYTDNAIQQAILDSWEVSV